MKYVKKAERKNNIGENIPRHDFIIWYDMVYIDCSNVLNIIPISVKPVKLDSVIAE